jgi:hypothetical protein
LPFEPTDIGFSTLTRSTGAALAPVSVWKMGESKSAVYFRANSAAVWRKERRQY